jgi:hypothetical protein
MECSVPPAEPVAWKASAVFNGHAWLKMRDDKIVSFCARTAFEARAKLAQHLGLAPQNLAVEQVPDASPHVR